MPDDVRPDEEFEALLVHLRDQRGADFTGYKRPSLTRLVHRRMRAAEVESHRAYVDLLQAEPSELAALLDVLLINVTSVFRDAAAWTELADTLLPEALDRLGPDEPVRVWSAACASGEEAYSLAILLHGLLGDEEYKRRVKIYATDIDEHALAVARLGRYTAAALEPLTPEQRATYFEPDGGGPAGRHAAAGRGRAEGPLRPRPAPPAHGDPARAPRRGRPRGCGHARRRAGPGWPVLPCPAVVSRARQHRLTVRRVRRRTPGQGHRRLRPRVGHGSLRLRRGQWCTAGPVHPEQEMAVHQLTGLDAAFLAMETSSVYGHVGSVCVLDPSTAPVPLTLERLQEVIASRLHLVPPFRRRLAQVPFGFDQPYWVEDPDFDIEFHVRELALPAPGGDRQLKDQTARLHARPLDRARPLWELYLISGLAGGRSAIYSKVHHAAIDGVSGNDILAAVLDLTPEGRDLGEVPEWECDKAPGAVPLLARSALSLAGQPLRAARLTADLFKSVPALAVSPGRPALPVVDRFLPRRGSSAVLEQTGLRAPRTPFNRSISPHRRWSFCTVPLDEVKEVKRVAGCTVNDVVMALTAGALRRWLLDHDALPDGPLVAAVPVSVRTEAQKGTGGNRISTMTAPLATHLADPLARLQHAHEAMRAAKEQHGALPAELLSDVTQFAMPALAGQAARLAARLRLVEWLSPFNLIVSNVPGPSVPLYYAGARLLAYYPVSAIADGQGLNITVMSYETGMHFGLIADRTLVPDLDAMADHLVEELALLRTALAAA